MKILAVANQKGGVGKSTLTVHLAYAAMEVGLRVLLVDMDKQGSASLTFQAKEGATAGLVASKLYDAEPNGEQPQTLSDRLAIIRADNGLLAIDKAENQIIRRPGQALRRLCEGFDLCLIDTPPLLGVRLMASLAAADYVVTPVSVGLYELAGVADLMQTIHVVRTQGFNPRLKHVGILPMKTNNRSTEEREALDALRQRYGAAIMPEVLPERAPVRQAIAKRVPVWTGTSGEGHLKAAHEWRAACGAILGKLAK
ncbi:ParA family protein [Xylella fastidiosa subsp. multiplex]|uniref:ParA family protein n=3 Tax=Xylella fastidiosa TaxID=2371 RepID=A0AAW6HXN7_XYLFS|nr:ParA family protein [Xylella fastidiosa]MDC6409549.1 ParA family protein [Xylella fastidiosa subsp. multiplex]MDD0936847.1 ParA family protein [Xylella fastidiosa subsp. multiplex]MSS68102.1 ParA family protein [Xylella fastidiosa subsp. multiplex]